jgi:isopenicillin-N epimerase
MEPMIERREFLGLGTAAAAAVLAGCGTEDRGPIRRRRSAASAEWELVRRRFALDPEFIHMAGMLLASHPRRVQEAVAEHRRELDRNPAHYIDEHTLELESAARAAAAAYLGAGEGDVALTESTTMGIALVYNGIAVRPDQEFLTTTHDYYATVESLRYRAQRTGASVRTVEPFASSATATADEVTDRIIGGITASTRVLALTWVHSWTGTKMPVRRIADRLQEVNADRAPDDRVLLALDGVHALGVEDFDLSALGCDFFMAGTHKWLFGPRGTGVLWGRPAVQDAVTPTIPTFSRGTGWGARMTRGGFTAFEHQWAMREAFEFHDYLGMPRVAERIRELNTRCKEGLSNMGHVRLHTPLDPDLSAGIIAFDVDGMSARAVVDRLAQRRIIASVTPYAVPHARLSPGLLNDESEVDIVLRAIADVA